MIITYGCMSFEVERVYRWENRAIYDESGVDYLYNHITIGVQAVLNPLATVGNHYTQTPFQPGPNGLAIGEQALETVRDIQALIMQPRQLLTVYLGGQLVLQSPLPRNMPAKQLDRKLYECDAKGGPKPLAFRVIAIHGTGKTLICAFEIETFVNLFNDTSAQTPTMLSNRWTMEQDIDELHYTTRTIRGTAVFRKDYLISQRFNRATNLTVETFPDDFRYYINHPIPANFQRQSVRVSQSADGTQLYYTIVDREMPGNLGIGSKVVRMAGTYTCGTSWQNLFGIISNDRGVINAPITTGLIGLGREMIRKAPAILDQILPRLSRNISLTVWGRRSTSTQDLIDFCSHAAGKFNFIDPAKGWGLKALIGGGYRWEIDLAHRRVSLYVHQEISGLTNRALQALGGGGQWPNTKEGDRFLDGIPDLYVVFDSNNPRPPDRGIRGTYLGVLMAQRLMNVAENPAAPPAHPSAAAVNQNQPEQRKTWAVESGLGGAGNYVPPPDFGANDNGADNTAL